MALYPSLNAIIDLHDYLSLLCPRFEPPVLAMGNILSIFLTSYTYVSIANLCTSIRLIYTNAIYNDKTFPHTHWPHLRKSHITFCNPPQTKHSQFLWSKAHSILITPRSPNQTHHHNHHHHGGPFAQVPRVHLKRKCTSNSTLLL